MSTFSPRAFIHHFGRRALGAFYDQINVGAVTEAKINSGLSKARDVYGIAALAVATLLFVAVGEWPYVYYQFLRIATFVLSLTILHREWGIERKGWLLFAGVVAVLFNPVLPLQLDKGDWAFADFIIAAGYAIYGIGLLTKRAAKIMSATIWALLAGCLALTFYVNHYMPHGPSYATGDIVCQNDDRGPCGEEFKEDTTHVDIPEWAKFLRENFVIALMSLMVAGVYCQSRAKDDDVDFSI